MSNSPAQLLMVSDITSIGITIEGPTTSATTDAGAGVKPGAPDPIVWHQVIGYFSKEQYDQLPQCQPGSDTGKAPVWLHYIDVWRTLLVVSVARYDYERGDWTLLLQSGLIEGCREQVLAIAWAEILPGQWPRDKVR